MIGSVDRSSDVNLTETGNQDGKSWVAFYTVKDGDNGTFQWNFHGIDRAGNALEKDTGLDQISALAFSDFSASPSETFGYLADTRTPKPTSIGIVADKAEDAFDYDNDSIHVLKSGDNLTLSFTTDESVDNHSLHPDLMIGSVDRSSDVNLTETGNQDGKSWVALYTVKDGDNGTFQWNFHGIDRAGNALEKDTGLDQISALAFSDFSASPSETFGYLADTRTPKLTSIGIVADKAEDAFDYDNDSIHVLKSGDNLTLSFTTDESVDKHSLHPDLMIGSVDRSSDVNLSETGNQRR